MWQMGSVRALSISRSITSRVFRCSATLSAFSSGGVLAPSYTSSDAQGPVKRAVSFACSDLQPLATSVRSKDAESRTRAGRVRTRTTAVIVPAIEALSTPAVWTELSTAATSPSAGHTQ